ncbi:MAG: hypothetical protein IJQ31_15055 [Thermoguttaceae bacterium]|nr:hypothetical protein [Thermoguttaceae bacterium]
MSIFFLIFIKRVNIPINRNIKNTFILSFDNVTRYGLRYAWRYVLRYACVTLPVSVPLLSGGVGGPFPFLGGKSRSRRPGFRVRRGRMVRKIKVNYYFPSGLFDPDGGAGVRYV